MRSTYKTAMIKMNEIFFKNYKNAIDRSGYKLFRAHHQAPNTELCFKIKAFLTKRLRHDYNEFVKYTRFIKFFVLNELYIHTIRPIG